MSSETHIRPELFQFLAELRENNNRAWFQANRDRYVSEVRDPLLAFVAELAEGLRGSESGQGCPCDDDLRQPAQPASPAAPVRPLPNRLRPFRRRPSLRASKNPGRR